MDKGKNRNDLIAAGRKKLQQYRKKKDQKGGGSEHHGRSSNTGTKPVNADTGGGHQDLLPDKEPASTASVELPADVDSAIGDSTTLPVAALLENLAVNDGGSAISGESVSLDLARSLPVTNANGKVQENRDPSNESQGVCLQGDKESAMEPDKEAHCLEFDEWKGGGKIVPEPNPSLKDNASNVAQLQIDERMDHVTVEDQAKIKDSRVVLVPEEAITIVCTEPDAACRDVGIESDLSVSLLTSESVNEQCRNILPSVNSEVKAVVLDENATSTSTQGTCSFMVQCEASQEVATDPCPYTTSNVSPMANEIELQSSLPDHFSGDFHRMEDTEANAKSGDGLCSLPTHSLGEETGSAHMQIPIAYTGDIHLITDQEQSVLFTEKGYTMMPTSPETVDASDTRKFRDLEPVTANFESGSEPNLSEASLILPPNFLEGQTADGIHTLMKRDEFGRVAFSNVVEGVENLKMHLYLTAFTNNVLCMQHDMELQAKSDIILSLSDEVSRLRDLLAICERSNVGNCQELVDCRFQLQTVILEKEVTRGHLISARKEIDAINNQVDKLQNKIEVFQEISTVLSVELLNCKALLEDSQIENAKLNEHIKVFSEEKQILGRDNDHLVIENSKLASDLLIQKDRLLAALNKQKQLEIGIEEYLAPVEELSKENLSLSVCLDAYRMKIKDLDCLHISLPQESEAGQEKEVRNIQARDAVDVTLKSHTSEINTDSYHDLGEQQRYYDLSKQAQFSLQAGTEDAVIHPSVPGYSCQQSVSDNADTASVLDTLKMHLLEATDVTQKLEQTIQGLHSQTLSLRKLKSASSGVTKLIQAFESKVPTDDIDETDRVTEDKSKDFLILTKHQILELKAVLELMDISVKKIECIFKEELNHRVREEKLLFEYAAQKSLNGKLEEKLCKVVNDLSSYKQELDVLHNQLEDISASTSCDTEGMITQLETLQGEVLGSFHAIQNEQKRTKSVTFETIKLLNESTGLLASDEMDLNLRVQESVHAAIETIEVLNKGLARLNVDHNIKCAAYEELMKEFKKMQGEREIATKMLVTVCSSIREILDGPREEQGERNSNAVLNEPLELTQKDTELILGRLKALLDERLLLFSAKTDLEVEVQNGTLNIQELRARCDFLSDSLEDQGHAKDKLEKSVMDCSKYIEDMNSRCILLMKKLEELKESDFADEIDFSGAACNNENHTMESHGDFMHILHLESLVDVFLKNYKKTLEEVILSKNHLKEVSSLLLIPAEQFLIPLHILMHEIVIPKIIEMRETQEKFHHQSSSMLKKENEIQVLKDVMVKMDEDLKVCQSEYNAKVVELEQSEQRFSSVREKLSIAVAKGKGLIVQRDNLKQSLVDKSGELDKCLQELQTKEKLLHDLEAKLKSYSEVDRVEALESELSYIRNSATAFRDSFLLKDSILQRIEEVLEDLDLPENFHTKDLVEKIELLARFATNNSSLLPDDWDRKGDAEGSHVDAGYAVVDSWQEQAPPTSTSDLDELTRSLEDLQNRFYGLAEHNEILEQSLVERNSLMQRCEENLDKVDMPSYLRSAEPDIKIEWLAKLMVELKLERDSLFAKVENLDESNESLLVNLEEQQRKAMELELEITATRQEKESLSISLDEIRSEYMVISSKVAKDELDKVQLQNDISDLQKKLAEKDTSYNGALDAMKKLQDLVADALPDCDTVASFSGECPIDYVEGLLKRLIEHYKTLCEKVVLGTKEPTAERSLDFEIRKLKELLGEKDNDLVALRSQLNEASYSLNRAKEEKEATRESYHSLCIEMEEIIKQKNALLDEKEATRESYHSLCIEMEEIIKQKNALLDEQDATRHKYLGLLSEVDALKKEKCALLDQVNQEEQKCASMKEKLNVAVRKGKGLVQQRDSLKQNIEEVTRKLDEVQCELNNRVAENLSLKNQLTEYESRLQNVTVTLNTMMSALYDIDNMDGLTSADPAQRLKEIGKLACDWRTAAISSENEAVKSRKAAELLVAELNEVQDRVDDLQEELSKAEAELDQCYRQMEIAESANAESQSQLELLVAAHSEERRKEAANVLKLIASINELRKGCCVLVNATNVNHSLHANVFRSLEASAKTILKHVNDGFYSQNIVPESTIPFGDATNKEVHLEVGSSDMNLHQDFNGNHVDRLSIAWKTLGHCLEELEILKDKIQENSSVVDQAGRHLMELMEFTQKEVTSQEASSESMKSRMVHLEKEIDERETEITLMQKNLAFLFEACRSSLLEIQSRKSQGRGEGKTPELVLPHGMEIPIRMSGSQDSEHQISRTAIPFMEDHIKTVAAALLAAVKSSGSMEEEIAEANQRELKSLISELQQELQEKDIQRNRIYEDLVSQIKAAESVARKYKEDLDFAKVEAQLLKDQSQVMKEENKSQEVRINELTNLEVLSKSLQQKINQLTESSAAKDQEIEGLMQALDEDEAQMNSLGIRNEELEKLLQEKNHALQSLESSRAKAMLKLSNTVNKFDELHQLSESLLAEIENLQLQLQEKESEISFLRHEVTRCTDDVLSEQEHNKKKAKEVHELRQSFLTILSRVGILDPSMVSPYDSEVQDYAQFIEKKLSSTMDELNDLRVISQHRESLLQIEKAKVEALTKKEQFLENSLIERDTQIDLYQRMKDSGHASTSHSGETVDQLKKSTITSSPVVPQFRSGRKVSDQIAIGIDLERDNSVEDEDDDKAHGFKSLTMSRIIPKATRPVADRIDGLWVSIERLLMRQPTLRLGLIFYWIAMHAMLAASI